MVTVESPVNDMSNSEALPNADKDKEKGNVETDADAASANYSKVEDLNDINLPHDDENGNPRLSQAQEFKGVNKPCPVTRGSRRGRGHPERGRGPRTRSLESDLVPYPSHYTRSRRQSMPAEATFHNHHDI